MSDDVKTINDEAMTRNIIASSPDVTHQDMEKSDFQKAKEQKEESTKAVNEAVIDDDKAVRDASIVQTGISSAYEEFAGETLNDAQEHILSSFAVELFEFFQMANVPRGVRLGVLGLSALLAFTPVILKFRKSKD